MCGRTNLSRLVWAAATVTLAGAGLAAAAPLPVKPGEDSLPPGAVARIGGTRLTHGGAVGTLAFSPDGKALATTSNADGTVRVWDLATGRESRRLDNSGDKLRRDVQQIAWSPDGETIATTGQDMVVHFRDADTDRKSVV